MSRNLRVTAIALLAMLSCAFVLAADTGPKDKVIKVRPALALVQDPTGTLTPYDNWAAYAWHMGREVPDRPDGAIDQATGKRTLSWPMIAEYPNTNLPSVVWYWEGSFRASNGYKWGIPTRWAYIRRIEEVWNPITQQVEVAGVTVGNDPIPPVPNPGAVPKSLRYIIDGLKLQYPTNVIQDAIDLSQFDEPQEGAPFDWLSALVSGAK